MDFLGAGGRERLVDSISKLTGAEINRSREILIRIENLKTVCLEMGLYSFEVMKPVARIRFREPLPNELQQDIESRYAMCEDDGKVGHFRLPRRWY
jgi:hypothetical protein